MNNKDLKPLVLATISGLVIGLVVGVPLGRQTNKPEDLSREEAVKLLDDAWGTGASEGLTDLANELKAENDAKEK